MFAIAGVPAATYRYPEGPFALVDGIAEEDAAWLPLPPGRPGISDVGIGKQIVRRPPVARHHPVAVILWQWPEVDRIVEIGAERATGRGR